MSIFSELTWRGVIKDTTSPEVARLLSEGSLTFYCGFDPTATSLHIGSLLPLITMRRLQLAGHRPLVVLGNATAAIGDPSFKSQERKLLSAAVIAENLLGVQSSIRQILGAEVAILQNQDWFKEISFIDFLRDIGKHFSVNSMIAKDSVRARLEDREQGISFTEFSYMLLQAQDFRHLFQNHGCRLQMGGSDQWGNITAGIELVRKAEGAEVFGLTMPLITKADGTKFGKTESGTIWLQAEKTSPFDFFQFLVRTEDKDVIKLLKLLTFLSAEEIAALEQSLHTKPELRQASRALATELTRIVHGEAALAQVLAKTVALFSARDISQVTPDGELTTTEVVNKALVDLLVELKLSTSKTMARKEVAGRAISINEHKEVDIDRKLQVSDIVNGRILISKGKSQHRVLVVKD